MECYKAPLTDGKIYLKAKSAKKKHRNSPQMRQKLSVLELKKEVSFLKDRETFLKKTAALFAKEIQVSLPIH